MYKNLIKFNSWICSWFRPRNRKKWLAEKEMCKTPYLLANHYIDNGYKWSNKKDRILDNMQRPDQFFGEGDCDDFANKSYTILKYHGYEVELWGIWKSETQGHAVVVVKDGDVYGLMSNRNYITPFRSRWKALDWFYQGRQIKRERIK